MKENYGRFCSVKGLANECLKDKTLYGESIKESPSWQKEEDIEKCLEELLSLEEIAFLQVGQIAQNC